MPYFGQISKQNERKFSYAENMKNGWIKKEKSFLITTIPDILFVSDHSCSLTCRLYQSEKEYPDCSSVQLSINYYAKKDTCGQFRAPQVS